jgi:hypothetical protein
MRTLFPRVAFLTNAFIGPCGVHTLFVLERQLGVWVHTTTSSKQRAFQALAEHVGGRASTESVVAAAHAELSVSYRDKSKVVAMRNRARHLVVMRDRYVGSIRIAAAVRALRPASNATGIDIPPAFEQCGVQKRVRVQFTVES